MVQSSGADTVPYRREQELEKCWSWRDVGTVLFLMLLALVLRTWNVATPAEQYFDEVYYVDAAEQLWVGEPDPNSVHPPLGKWIIGAGMEASRWVAGPDVNEVLSWRIAAVLAGVLMVGATYCFSLTIFQYNRWAATAAAVFVATEHLHLSMTRIAMLDPFLALFCLVGAWWSFAYLLGGHERWAVLGALSLGLATACKWSGLFTAFGCVLAGFWLDKQNRFEEPKTVRYIFWLILMVSLGFFGSYFHLFLGESGFSVETLETIFHQGERMVKFRYNPEQFVHGYKSYFYQWPLVLRPIWLHYEEPNGVVEGICSMGVWLTWWLFSVLLLERIYTCFIKGKDRISGALVLLWFGQWLPWVVSKTGGFFYYMLPEVPVMGLLLGKWFSDLGNFDDALGEGRWRAWLLAGVILVGALLYFPFATAAHVPKAYFQALFFLPDWI